MLFGVGYPFVHLLDTALLAIAAGGNRDLRQVLMRIAPSAAIAPLVILAAGVVGGSWQVALWGIALAIEGQGRVMIDRGVEA